MIPDEVTVALQVYSSARINGLTDADTNLRHAATQTLLDYLKPKVATISAPVLPVSNPTANHPISKRSPR